MLLESQINKFQETIWTYYRQAARPMPWRQSPSPYFVLVSEIMLQQTQVSRVYPKFEAFIKAFPDVQALAAATFAEVLQLWSGLGYHRRAKFLHMAAKKIVLDFDGEVPHTKEALLSLSGVGANTAGAILAYAFNQPVVFIETNIRTVYFYHFFAADEIVSDAQLAQLVGQTLDSEHPREWYWALMDYGAYLKRHKGNNITQSKHYTKQSAFEGSKRQVRGAVLRALLDGPQTAQQLAKKLSDRRLPKVLLGLSQEGFIIEQDEQFRLAE